MLHQNQTTPSMLTPKPRAHHGRRVMAGRPKLTLEQKRSLTVAWFLDPSLHNIQEFCVDNGVPQARPFLRKCAKDLRLWSLRKQREGNEGSDEEVRAKIEAWRPHKKNREEEKPAVSETTETLDDESITMLLMGFFGDPTEIPFGRYLRQNGARSHRHELIAIVKEVQLNRMRRKREEEGVRDEVIKRVEQALANRELEKKQQQGMTAEESMSSGDDSAPEKIGICHVKAGASSKGASSKAASSKALKLVLSDPAKTKSLLVGWFDSPQNESLVEFLEGKDLLREPEEGADMMRKKTLRALRVLIRRGDLQLLRKARDQKGVRGVALQIIEDQIAAAVASSNGGQDDKETKEVAEHRHIGAKKKVTDATNDDDAAEEPEARKPMPVSKTAKVILQREMVRETSPDDRAYFTALVSEWYDDEKNRPLPRFLREREETHLAPTVVPLVRRNRLHRLRKHRDDPEVRKVAEAKIADMFHEVEGKHHHKPKHGGGLAEPERETLKSCLVEWFYDEDQATIDAFLQENGRPEWKPIMARIVKKQGLHKLRKQRFQIRQVVTRKIDYAFVGGGGVAGRGAFGAKKVVPSAPTKEVTTEGEMSDFVDVAEGAKSSEENSFVVH